MIKIKKVFSIGVCSEVEERYGGITKGVTCIFCDYDTFEEAEEHLKMLNDHWFILERYIRVSDGVSEDNVVKGRA